MNESIKKVVIFAIFILVLLLFSLTSFFSESLLWPNSDVTREFDGIIFNNAEGIDDFNVFRSTIGNGDKRLVKYDIKFNYSGEDSTARILGTPVRQIFFGEGVNYKKSNANLKGDFDKVNETLFQEKLRLKDFFNKTNNKEFSALSEIKLDLSEEIGEYDFTVYYKPSPLYFSGAQRVEDVSVFVTNSKVNDWQESTKKTDSVKEAFNNSGYYINKLETVNEKLVSKIATLNTVSTVLFILITIATLALLWIKKGNFKIYLVSLFVMIPTFYRFIGKGTSNLGVLIAYPILAFIASIIAKLISKEEIKLNKNDLKQSLAFAILYFIASIVLFIIPRTFI